MSGMLAPVGIGITGALLIVCALYSIRMIHSFKHQRRKVRQQEVSSTNNLSSLNLLKPLVEMTDSETTKVA